MADAVELRRLLLRLLAPTQAVAQAEVDALGPADWDAVADMVRQHRLGPLLHWMTLKPGRPALPPELMADWSSRRRGGTMRALAVQRELILIHRLLADAGIPHLFLKGAFLAFDAYPEPSLRPLRDIDVLVPPERALEALSALLDSGGRRIGSLAGDPAAAVALGRQHLQPIRSPFGSSAVEIHMRLLDDDRGLIELSEDSGFWSRAFTASMGGEKVPVTGIEDLAIHLIAHAVYSHCFDNGPLILSDLAFLLDRYSIDWPVFWSLADRIGCTRGAILTLRLTESSWGQKRVDYALAKVDNAAVDDSTLATAALLMLRDFDARSVTNLRQRLDDRPSRSGRLGLMAQRIFRSRLEVAAQFPVRADSPRVFLYYPAVWWTSCRTLISAWRGTASTAHVDDEVRRLAEVAKWLGQTA